jgi:predicted MFS family arabinose efflux permease
VIGHQSLADRRVLGLLGCLSLQRISVAAFPAVLIVATVDARGLWPAAVLQGARVVTGTFTAPLRARVLDRIGRHRVIVPQTMLVAVLLLLLGAAVTSRGVPIPLALAAAIAPAAVSPATDSVIRTLWRDLGRDEQQVKSLHAYDSILEEVGYLAGPALASVLMIGLGPDTALFTVIGAMIAGYCLVLLSRQVRSALRPRPGSKARPPAPTRAGGPARRFARTLAGPIASRELQRIVLPLILMGSVFGVVGILAPALSARAGHPDVTGFVLASISLGGVIGALIYSAAKVTWPLRVRHAALGLVFGLPLLFGFAADSVWALAALLVLGGLAVTPLYINAYLMMDEEIPPDVIHEANTWVPVGNNVGYVLGITIGASLLGHADVRAALAAVTVFATLLVAYSGAQLASARRAAVQDPVEA